MASTSAPQLPIGKRIPESLPLVVRPRQGMLMMLLLLAIAIYGLMFVFCLLLAIGFETVEDFRSALVYAVLALVLSGAVALAFYRWVRQARRGPVLAADVDGVWLRRTSVSTRVIFVPWAAVQQIRTVRWGLTQMVYVEVHPAVRWPADGPFGSLTAGLQQLAGKGAAISVTYSDIELHPFLTGMYQLSGGRVPIR
jgi:hypothetical protein